MRRTVTRHRSPDSPAGDTTRTCGYCGVEWHRSKLRRDAAGLLACPDDQPGLDSVSLSEGNAARAGQRRLGQYTDLSDGGIDPPNTTPAPPFKSPNGPPVARQNQGPTGPLSVIVELWLRGDSAVATNGVLSRWADLSGRSNDCFPVNSASAPTVAVDADGLPMVNCDGLTQRIVATNQQSLRPTWLWAICSFPNISFTTTVALRADVGLALSGGNNLRAIGSGLGSVLFISSATWSRAMVTADALDATNTIRCQGFSANSVGIGQQASSRVVLGAGTSAGVQAASVIFKEVLLTAGIPTATEIAAIEAYGVLRYGGGLFA